MPGLGTAPQTSPNATPGAAPSRSLLSGLPGRDLCLTLVFAALSALLWLAPTGFEERLPADALQVKARIESTDNAHVHRYGLILEGEQRVEARALEGRFTGQVFSADNIFLGKIELDKFFAPGDTALLVLSLRGGKVVGAVAQDHYRLGAETLLLGLFALLLVAYGGWTGVKALVSFIFAALLIWKQMVPLFLRGHDPILITLAVLAALMAAVLFLVGGLNRKALSAYLGSLLGVGATCGLALALAPGFTLHGAVKPYAETLLYSGYASLDVTRIFLATIFLGSSGAVMDLAMDVAASLDELTAHRPDLGFWPVFSSGLRVGRVVVGTMTTTLLLAYSGGSMMLLMVFMAQGVPAANIFNMSHVAAEVLNTLVGSLGLVSVAPFTALAGALLLTRRPAVVHAAAPASAPAQTPAAAPASASPAAPGQPGGPQG
jgi:uncharacterized membrane protein